MGSRSQEKKQEELLKNERQFEDRQKQEELLQKKNLSRRQLALIRRMQGGAPVTGGSDAAGLSKSLG